MRPGHISASSAPKQKSVLVGSQTTSSRVPALHTRGSQHVKARAQVAAAVLSRSQPRLAEVLVVRDDDDDGDDDDDDRDCDGFGDLLLMLLVTMTLVH